jgi:hypothetical protein
MAKETPPTPPVLRQSEEIDVFGSSHVPMRRCTGKGEHSNEWKRDERSEMTMDFTYSAIADCFAAGAQAQEVVGRIDLERAQDSIEGWNINLNVKEALA